MSKTKRKTLSISLSDEAFNDLDHLNYCLGLNNRSASVERLLDLFCNLSPSLTESLAEACIEENNRIKEMLVQNPGLSSIAKDTLYAKQSELNGLLGFFVSLHPRIVAALTKDMVSLSLGNDWIARVPIKWEVVKVGDEQQISAANVIEKIEDKADKNNKIVCFTVGNFSDLEPTQIKSIFEKAAKKSENIKKILDDDCELFTLNEITKIGLKDLKTKTYAITYPLEKINSTDNCIALFGPGIFPNRFKDMFGIAE